MIKTIQKALIFLFCGMALFTFTACESEGPAEKTGERIDEAVEETQEGIEEAGDALEEAAEETGEELEEAGEDLQKD